jgi:polysaccharide biosynthesis/export protein VpsN
MRSGRPVASPPQRLREPAAYSALRSSGVSRINAPRRLSRYRPTRSPFVLAALKSCVRLPAQPPRLLARTSREYKVHRSVGWHMSDRNPRLLPRLCILAVCLVIPAVGCQTARGPSGQVEKDMLIEPDEALGVDDVFEVRVAGEEDMTGLFRVTGDGTIDFPYVGRLNVVSLRSGDVQKLIAERLKTEAILVNPQVVVTVKEWNSRKVAVLGQVNKPGSVAYFPRMTIVDAIAAAGGFTGIAAKNNVRVRREQKGGVISKSYPVADISEGRAGNVFLLPGDVLVVDERIF